MSDARVLTDVGLMGVCDQLSDDELSDLGSFAEDGEAAPEYLMQHLTPAASDLLKSLFLTELGRLQVLDAVELEKHARRGGV